MKILQHNPGNLSTPIKNIGRGHFPTKSERRILSLCYLLCSPHIKSLVNRHVFDTLHLPSEKVHDE